MLRMTDERLLEINYEWAYKQSIVADKMHHVLDAFQAERDEVKRLEAEIDAYRTASIQGVEDEHERMRRIRAKWAWGEET